ncbi:MAG: cysteine desulfurase [Acidobacteria bacterium]|nr:cysteine desulfurase [Acidobacteriota bacterium]
MTLRRVYMDNSATTPVDRRVVEAMMPYLTEKFGNPSSVHFYGQEARAAVDRARREVAALINARPNEIVLLSGGTEANNDTVLITVMLANNEIGTVQPIAEIGTLVRELRAGGRKYLWLHTDGVQALGRMPVNVETLGCDLLSMSAHKLHAPQGVGALYVRRSVRLAPQNIGGHQERERRGGTEAVSMIVAFGTAAALAREELDARIAHMRALRARFEAGVTERISDVIFNGDTERRLPHISNVSFRFIEGEGLLINLDMQGVAVSTGSACSSGSLEPSPVIRALGRGDELARGSIRFSIGKDTTDEDIDYVLEVLPRAVENLRRLSPLYQQAIAERACTAV